MLEKIKGFVSENFSLLVGYKVKELENGNVEVTLEMSKEDLAKENSFKYDSFENYFGDFYFEEEDYETIQFKNDLEEKVYNFLVESFKIEEICFEIVEIGKVKRVIFSNPKILQKGLQSRIDYIESFTRHKVLTINDSKDGVYIDLVEDFKIDNVVVKNKEGKFYLGKDIYGEDLFVDYDLYQTAIFGGMGSGKTILMYNLINQVINNKDLAYFIDFKNGNSFSELKNKKYDVYTENDLEKINDFLSNVIVESNKRSELLKENGKKHIKKMKKIFIFIEELEYLKQINDEKTNEILNKLEMIWAIGRALGIFVISSSQRTTPISFGRNGFHNQTLKIQGKTFITSTLEKVFDKEGLKLVSNFERGGYFVMSGVFEDKVNLFRSPFVDEINFVEQIVENQNSDYKIGE